MHILLSVILADLARAMEPSGLSLLVEAMEIEKPVEETAITTKAKLQPKKATDGEVRYVMSRFWLDQTLNNERLLCDFFHRFPQSRLTDSALSSYWKQLSRLHQLNAASYGVLVAQSKSGAKTTFTLLRMQMGTTREPARKLMLWYDHVIRRGKIPLFSNGIAILTPAQSVPMFVELSSEISFEETREEAEWAGTDHCLRDRLVPTAPFTNRDLLVFGIRLLQISKLPLSQGSFWDRFARGGFESVNQKIYHSLNQLLLLQCFPVGPFAILLADPTARGPIMLRWFQALEATGDAPVRSATAVCLTERQYFVFLEKMRVVVGAGFV